jgi:hypothetical protein
MTFYNEILGDKLSLITGIESEDLDIVTENKGLE